MAFKKLTVELFSADGKPLAGIPVKATGCSELNSSPVGTTLFLLEEPSIAIEIEGKEVFSAALDDMPAKLAFTQDGGNWKKQ